MRGVQLLSPTFCLCFYFCLQDLCSAALLSLLCWFQLQLLPSAQGDTILCCATSPETANFSVNKFPREKHTREKDLEQTSRELLSAPKNSWKLSGIAFLQQTLLKSGKHLARTTVQNPWGAHEPLMLYKEFRELHWVMVTASEEGLSIASEFGWTLIT